jgi:phasin family protein
MQNDIVKNMEMLNKAAIESAKRLGDINMRTLEKLAQRNLEATADYLEGGVRQMKLIGETKDVQAAVQEQSKLATELNEKFVKHAKKTAAVLTEVKGELTEWAEDGMQAAGAPLNGKKKAA